MAAEQAVPATAHVNKAKPTKAPVKTAAKKATPKAKAVAPDSKASMKDQLAARKENYTKVKTEGGKIAIDNGDEVAAALRDMTLEDVYKYTAKTTGIALTELHGKYDHLNNGQQRMNLGNRLRKAFREANAAEAGE